MTDAGSALDSLVANVVAVLAEEGSRRRVELSEMAQLIANLHRSGRHLEAVELAPRAINSGPVGYAGLMLGFADIYCGHRDPAVDVLPSEDFRRAVTASSDPVQVESGIRRFLGLYESDQEDLAVHHLVAVYTAGPHDRCMSVVATMERLCWIAVADCANPIHNHDAG